MRYLMMGAVADDQKWFAQLEDKWCKCHAAVSGNDGECL